MTFTREEIIGALKDAIEEMDGEQTVAVPVLFLKDVYRLLTIDEMPTVGGWISVKDRLPERMERYLVVFYPPATCKQVMEVSLCKDGWYRNRIRIADEYITHWMPLPEPPKEVSGE